MLIEEAQIIGNLLVNIRDCLVLNVCSSDEKFYREIQPHIWEFVIRPLKTRGNRVINLDLKSGSGIDIVNDCCDMKDVTDKDIDVVLFFSGVEHILKPQNAIGEIYRVLKNDGLLFASAPGVYPRHNDPVDTMLRLPGKSDWEKLLGDKWSIVGFDKTRPIPAKKSYNFPGLVFATIITATKRQ